MNATLEAPKDATAALRTQMESWTAEEREMVFLALVDELISQHPVEAIIPIDGGDGIERGHLVTPKGVRGFFEKYGPKLTKEQLRSDRSSFGTGKTISWDETMEILSEPLANQCS